MDVNGSRFHLLLTRQDWGACRAAALGLGEAWDASPPRDADAGFSWDAARQELTLAELTPRFIAAKGDAPPDLDARRGAARDAFGNLYWIDETRRAIRVVSAGSGRPSRFWPDDRPPPPPVPGAFGPVATPERPLRELSGLAVTEDHYLVVGTLDPAGLLVFDLHAVGEPAALEWPREIPFAPYDLAARPGGGVAILDRTARRYWLLDRRLALEPGQEEAVIAAGQTDDFQPAAGEPRGVDARSFAHGVRLDHGSPILLGDVIAIEALPEATVIVLEADGGDGFARVAAYRGGLPLGEPVSLRLFAGEVEEDAREGFRLVGYDMALLPGDDGGWRLLVVSAEGNQAFEMSLILDDNGLGLRASRAFFPMRRFAGKGLAAGGGEAFYDFGHTWIPLIAQRTARYAREAQLETPALDSGIPDCVWHRLLFDGCLPTGSDVAVATRAADDPADLSTATWRDEPSPYRRGDGRELPWSGAPRDDLGAGSWELLFQAARGRYLQVRLTLRGNERATPRIAALRAWFPRFSYLEQYLPAIYREDPTSASFLDRFLANIEGTETTIEGRIAAAQTLFDVRSAPADALDWLAKWFGVALDPAWDERRRRLFIRHAMTFFRWRGTAHGLRMALSLALDPCIDEAMLGDPGQAPARPHDIRIIERFMTRRFTPLSLGDPLEIAGPRTVIAAAAWTPDQGGAQLSQLYAEAVKDGGAYPLVPPQGDAAADWRAFSAATLGFVPSMTAEIQAAWTRHLGRLYGTAGALPAAYGGVSDLGQVEAPFDLPPPGPVRADWRDFLARAPAADLQTLQQWQAFLARRYRRLRALTDRYAGHWESFDEVGFPAHLPSDGPALVDWHLFEGKVGAMRLTAHRFSVLAPAPRPRADRARARDRLELARRITALEKPAHTTFSVGLYWALFRVGEARLGLDTILEAGSRSPDLLPPIVLGLDYVGEGHLDRTLPPGRQVLECA